MVVSQNCMDFGTKTFRFWHMSGPYYKRKEGGRAIGRGGEEEREGGRVGKKEGGRTEGTMEGWRERGIRNREHLGKLWGVLESSGGFRGVLGEFGERKERMEEEER